VYLNPQELPPIVRRLRKTKVKAGTRPGTPVGLFGNISQNLHKSLYSGLHPDAGHVQSISSHYPTASIHTHESLGIASSVRCHSGIFVRQVSLLPGESISYIFSPENGRISKPLTKGLMLVLTNLRVMTFGQKDGVKETVLIPLEEVKAVAVNAGQRSKGTLFQGGVMIVAAVFFYVMLAYWLAGRIDGPTVPIIRMDLVAFVVFLAILIGVTMLAQMYFAKPDGEVTFQGDSVKFTFPFRGEAAEDEIYTVVNAVFTARQVVNSDAEWSVD
jgi:hypothetical protein